jgi:hypothetical protein
MKSRSMMSGIRMKLVGHCHDAYRAGKLPYFPCSNHRLPEEQGVWNLPPLETPEEMIVFLEHMLPWEFAGHKQYVIMVPQFELSLAIAKTATAPPAPAPLESDDSDDSATCRTTSMRPPLHVHQLLPNPRSPRTSRLW